MATSRRRYRVARAAAATLFDRGTGDTDADLDALVEDLHDFLVHARWRTALAIRGAQTLLQLYPVVTGRGGRFTRLSPEKRAETLLALERSGSLGKAWAGLKLMLAMLWFDGPAGAKSLPEQVRKTKALEATVDPLETRLGPDGPLPKVRAGE